VDTATPKGWVRLPVVRVARAKESPKGL